VGGEDGVKGPSRDGADLASTDMSAEPSSRQEESQPSFGGGVGGLPVEPEGEAVRRLESQLEEVREKHLRLAAEFDNYRKRIDRERQTLADATAAEVMQELLPLVDDLERALKAEPGAEGADAYRRGVELIHKRLEEILRRHGVRPIEALGADFDPNYHQAVAHEPADDRRDGEVIEEFRRGYMLGDRLLRPSMVKVAKGAQ
jgi:molecular chaperone GrpE